LRRNQRKIQILSILSESNLISAEDLSYNIDETSTANIMALLLRYYRYGLVKRKKFLGKYRYSISQKGIERMNYLRNKNS